MGEVWRGPTDLGNASKAGTSYNTIFTLRAIRPSVRKKLDVDSGMQLAAGKYFQPDTPAPPNRVAASRFAPLGWWGVVNTRTLYESREYIKGIKTMKKVYQKVFYKYLHNKCWRIIEKLEPLTFEIAKNTGIPIYRMEYVAVFEYWSKDIEIYIFYAIEDEKNRAEDQGFTLILKEFYLDKLKERKYPFSLFPTVNFIFDSDENVKNNYEGSYFFRLR
jgi:hypothetical protein